MISVKNRWSLLVAVLAALPVFFIHVCSTHDWGDDFARYLEQARNLMNGLPQDKTHFIANPDFFIGPPSYPTGFPIILAIWGKIFSLEILSLNYLLSFFMFLCGIAMLFIFRKHFSLITSVCLLLLFLYHPLGIGLKNQILSDIPYTALSLFTLLFYKPSNKKWLIVSGFLLAFSVHLRTAGFALVAAFLLLHLIEIISGFKKAEKMNRKNYLFFWGSALTLFFLVKIIFPVHSEYSMSVAGRSLKETVLTHSYYYLWVLDGSVKEYSQGDWRLLGMIAGSAFIVLAILGWILSMKKDPAHRLYGFYCLAYYLLISFYPYGNSGFRFIFPVYGFILFYAAIALSYFLREFNFNKKILAVILAGVLMFQFSFGWKEVIRSKTDVLNGPQTKESQEVFGYLRKQALNHQKVCFVKPKVLSYYCDADAVSIDEFRDASSIMNDLEKQDCRYYLYYSGISGEACLQSVSADTSHWNSVFTNSAAKLFRRK